jgi:AcrR family transcriptional regulator
VSRSTQPLKPGAGAANVAAVAQTKGSENADGSAAPERALRADARRNRDALLAAGAEVFAERGADASLEEVARKAGVGIGTLYRHFPDRDALTEAVYRNEVEHLCGVVDDLLAEHPADVALYTWMSDFAVYAAAKRGMMVSLKAMVGANSEIFNYSHGRIHGSIKTLVDAAVAEGSIRDDVDSEALLTAMRGVCMTDDSAANPERTALLLGLLVDGLRYRAPVSTR